MSIGVTFPFAASTGSIGYLEVTQDLVSAITSNVSSLLVTNWGERVMHADFGCNLREFLFEQQTQQLGPRIKDRIKSQLRKWMPFLELTELFLVFSDDDPSLQDHELRLDLTLNYGPNVKIVLSQKVP